MQFPQPTSHTQLPLFEAFLATQPSIRFEEPGAARLEPEVFSEVSLRGAAGPCLGLLAPMLRELSCNEDGRWLTLIAPPKALTQAWLRDAGLNRERILILHPRGNQNALQLAGEALKLGRSHTVVSWLHPLEANDRRQLEQAARHGRAQSLNISLE